MELSKLTLSSLFQQLGLPADDDSIEQFVARHSPLPRALLLSDAPFWTAQQKALLKEEFRKDADWSHAIDELNSLLHSVD